MPQGNSSYLPLQKMFLPRRDKKLKMCLFYVYKFYFCTNIRIRIKIKEEQCTGH
jgi:hypothetical protein